MENSIMRYVIGDIHGMFDKMSQALDYSGFDPEEDTLYGLGDFADRGPDSLKVIDYLMGLRDFRSVFGNHDMWLYQFLRSDIQFVDREKFDRNSVDHNYKYFGEKVLIWPEDSLFSRIRVCWENDGAGNHEELCRNDRRKEDGGALMARENVVQNRKPAFYHPAYIPVILFPFLPRR